jgi:hypothetical protein
MPVYPEAGARVSSFQSGRSISTKRHADGDSWAAPERLLI